MAVVVWNKNDKAIPPLHEKSRHFALASGDVHVEQGWGEGGVGMAQWLAGMVLAGYIEAHAHLWTGARVIELGAGAGGLVSIALLRAGAHVVATDGDECVLPLLRRNLAANANTRHLRGVELLTWGDGAHVTRALACMESPPGVVVAADLVYPGTRPAWPALLDTIAQLGQSPLVLLAHTHRHAEDDADFLDLAASKGFVCRTLPYTLDAASAHELGGGGVPAGQVSIYQLSFTAGMLEQERKIEPSL